MMRAHRLRRWFGTRLRGWADTVDPGAAKGRGGESGFGGLNLVGAPEHWVRLVRESALQDASGPVTVGSRGSVGSTIRSPAATGSPGTEGSRGTIGSSTRRALWWRGRSAPVTAPLPPVTDPLLDDGRGAAHPRGSKATDPPRNAVPPTGSPGPEQDAPTSRDGEQPGGSNPPDPARRATRLILRSPAAVIAPPVAGRSTRWPVDADRPGRPGQGPTAHTAPAPWAATAPHSDPAAAADSTASRADSWPRPSVETVPGPTVRSDRAAAPARLMIGGSAGDGRRPAIAGEPLPRTGVDRAPSVAADAVRAASRSPQHVVAAAIRSGPQPVAEVTAPPVGQVAAAGVAAAVDQWPELPSAVLSVPDTGTAPSVVVLARIDRLNREQAAT